MKVLDWLLVKGWLELGRAERSCLLSGCEIVGWVAIGVGVLHVVWGGR